jgi:hypothetical protein
MSELYIEHSDDEHEAAAAVEVLDIQAFESQPFLSKIDPKKTIFVYFGMGWEFLRTRECNTSNVVWIRAENQNAYTDCLHHIQTGKNCVCIVDSSFQTFRSLITTTL